MRGAMLGPGVQAPAALGESGSAPEDGSLPGSRLGVAITVLLVAGGIFGVLTVAVVLDGAGGVASIDASVLHSAIAARAGWLTDLAKAFTAFGTGPVVYGLLILVGLAVWRRTGTWVPAAVAVGALAVGQAVRLGISDAVARARPPEQVWLVHPGGYAYPSGHTTTAVIGYGLFAGLAAGLVRRWSVALFAAAGLLAVAVAGSRVYSGVHWLSDVVGGWMFGVAWLALVYTGASARITLPRAGSDRDRKAGGRRPRPRDGRPSARETRAVTRPEALPAVAGDADAAAVRRVRLLPQRTPASRKGSRRKESACAASPKRGSACGPRERARPTQALVRVWKPFSVRDRRRLRRALEGGPLATRQKRWPLVPSAPTPAPGMR